MEGTEVWKPIVGYEGLYEVSDQGNIRTTKRQGSSGGLKEKTITDNGYYVVSLYKDGKGKRYLVHRLVAEAFMGPAPNEKPFVDHIDGNRLNCTKNNLRYVSCKENIYNPNTYNNWKKTVEKNWEKITNEMRSQNQKKAALSRKKEVIGINLKTNEIITAQSAADIEKQYNISAHNIYSCCNGLRKSAGGYKWEYA